MDKHIIVKDKGEKVSDVNITLPTSIPANVDMETFFAAAEEARKKIDPEETEIDLLRRMQSNRLMIGFGADPNEFARGSKSGDDVIHEMNSIFQENKQSTEDPGIITSSDHETEVIDYLFEDEKDMVVCPGSNSNRTVKSYEVSDLFKLRMPKEILDDANYDEEGKFKRELSSITWPKVYDHSGLNSLSLPSRRAYIIPPEFESYIRGTSEMDSDKLQAMYSLWREDLWDHLKTPPDWMKPEYFLLSASDHENGSIIHAQYLIARNNFYLKRALSKSGGVFAVRERLAKFNNTLKHTSVIDNTSATFVRCLETLCKDQKACLEYLPQLIRAGAETLSDITSRATNEICTIERASKTKIDQLIRIFETKFNLDDSTSGKVMDSRYNSTTATTSTMIPSYQVALNPMQDPVQTQTTRRSRPVKSMVAID